MVTSVYQFNVMPPNSVHIHAEAKAGQACGLGTLFLPYSWPHLILNYIVKRT